MLLIGHNQLLTRDTIDGLFDKLKHMFPASSGTAMDDTTPHSKPWMFT